MEEQWKEIDGYDGFYEVSNKGRIRTWKNNRWGRLDEPKIKDTPLSKTGYPTVSLSYESVTRCFFVHRLLAKAFIPNPENKPQVNHIDGDKTNNNLYNLEWVTDQENKEHASSIGLLEQTEETKRKIADANKGSKHGMAKLNEDDIIEIRRLYKKKEHNTITLGELYSISRHQIGHIVNNRAWKHV